MLGTTRAIPLSVQLLPGGLSVGISKAMLGGHLNKGFFSGYRLRPTLSTVAFVVPLECSIAPNSGLTYFVHRANLC